MTVELLPIKERLEDNLEFLVHPDCRESLEMSVKFMASVGYHRPWICYYASLNNQLVGSAAFKGKPKNNVVEIAYGVFAQFQHRGIGAKICKRLVDLSLQTDPSVIITARTLREENYSVRILRKNKFKFVGTVIDPDDGEVWEWEYVK